METWLQRLIFWKISGQAFSNTKVENFTVTLTVTHTKTIIQKLIMMYHQTSVWSQMDQHFRKYRNSHISII